jgi:hypothetical protein
LPPGAAALAAGGAGTADGTICVLGSAGALAATGGAALRHGNPGWVQAKAPAPAATTAEAAAPTQINVFCDGMLARSLATYTAERSLRQISAAEPSINRR